MAKFAPIAPIRIQDTLGDVMGDYHLLIASEVLSQPTRYHAYYQRYRLSHPNLKVIMDNGLIETGEPLDLAKLMSACRVVESDWLVLPDALGKEEDTVQMHRDAIENMNVLRFHGAIDEKRLMGVVQGETFGELQSCASSVCDLPGVSALCVPRYVANKLGTRQHIVKWINEALCDLPIHLLGFSNKVDDDIYCAHLPGVMGIDSALPVWFAMDYGDLASLPIEPDARRPKKFWSVDALSERVLKQVALNIELVRGWIE